MWISIIWNIDVSVAYVWWVPSHIQCINLSFHSFEENETISFMSTMILPGCIFSWKLPVINRTAMSKTIDNIICGHFKINVVDIHFKYFLSIIVEHWFSTACGWLHSSLVRSILSFLWIWILFIFSTISPWIQIVLMFWSIIIIPHILLRHWCLPIILLHVLLLDWWHVILMVLVIVWRMISLVLHSYLLVMHLRSVTSILSHSLMMLGLSIAAVLSLHRSSIVVIRMHIIHIPNWMVISIWHLSLVWLVVVLSIVAHSPVVRVIVVHLFL